MATPPDHVLTDYTITIVGSAVGATALIVLWLMREFSKTRNTFYRVMSRHNREDDANFAHLNSEIWKIHMRNAIRDGQEAPERSPMPRRRYLVDDAGDDDKGAEMETA